MKWIALCASLLVAACGSGDAGCMSYGIERGNRPASLEGVPGQWASWVADLDDRMTGACR